MVFAVEDRLYHKLCPNSSRISHCNGEVLHFMLEKVPLAGSAAEGSWLTKWILETFPPHLY